MTKNKITKNWITKNVGHVKFGLDLNIDPELDMKAYKMH